MDEVSVPPYLEKFRGEFHGVLRWPQLDSLWQVLRNTKSQWYVYAVGESPAVEPLTQDQLENFIEEIDQLLRKEHKEDYCGIVYADNLKVPEFIKIFDPHNLGVSCGFSDNPPLPGWILSQMQPIDIPGALLPPKSRQHWWQKLF
jgi:hypothetical protein